MDIQAKRQALESLVAPKPLMVDVADKGFYKASRVVYIADRGGNVIWPRQTAQTAETLIEYLWEDLVDKLPDDAHVVIVKDEKRVRWNGTAWQELSKSELDQYTARVIAYLLVEAVSRKRR